MTNAVELLNLIEGGRLFIISDELKQKDKRLKNISMVYFPSVKYQNDICNRNNDGFGDFEFALSESKKCNVLGYTDWRLPQQKILRDKSDDKNEYKALVEHRKEFGEKIIDKLSYEYEYWSGELSPSNYNICCYADYDGVPKTFITSNLNLKRFFFVR